MEEDRNRSVCVIGAGAAGLVSIKACLEAGFSVTAFEQSDKLGGLWNIRSSSRDSTVTNSSSKMSSFSDFPVPSDWPPYLPRDLVLQYLQDYAAHFDLTRHISFKTMVLKVEKKGREWLVTVSQSPTNESKTHVFDNVMVCVGHHSDPVIPVVRGSQEFGGKIMHSKFFDPKDEDLSDKRVVVIGSGNSAGDAAVEASNHASNVLLAMRTGAHVVRRTSSNGVPVDEVLFRRSTQLALNVLLPFRGMRNFVLGKINDLMHFKHSLYNFPEPDHGLMDRQPMINDLILHQIITGKLHALPIESIDKFTKDSIVFAMKDGSRQSVECDVVVYATGYVRRNQFIASLFGDEEFLYKKIFSPSDLTMGLIGHVQPLGPQFPLMEMQARFFVHVQQTGRKISRRHMERAIAEDVRDSRSKGMDADSVTWMPYMSGLAREMGVHPAMFKLFFSDHKLWRKLFFHPMTPDQFRLFPGSMD